LSEVNVQKRVGARVRSLREERKLLQKDVADALHISVSAYAKLESGDRGINSENCIALADLFGVSCDYILRGIEAEYVDICAKTGLSQETINVLISNRINAKPAALNQLYEDLLNDLLDRMDETNDRKQLTQLRAEYDQKESEQLLVQVNIKDHEISNSLLNYLISDRELWSELSRASYQYVTCLEELFGIYKPGENTPSFEVVQNMMGLDAAKYIAGQAFGTFFSKTMKNESFYRTMSIFDHEEIDELVKQKLLDPINK